MTKREKSFFNICREIAKTSDYNRARLGAIVVEGKRIISTGNNQKKTRPLQHKYNIYRDFQNYVDSIAYQHAEIAAISPLIGKEIDWSKVSIYVYRIKKDGSPGCSKPCKACAQLIKDLGIRTVYYIDDFGRYIKEKVLIDEDNK